jgi:hypothetical protein
MQLWLLQATNPSGSATWSSSKAPRGAATAVTIAIATQRQCVTLVHRFVAKHAATATGTARLPADGT